MDLNQLRKNYRPINLQPPQAQALQQGGRGGFLSSLISEGSAAAGAGIGTAIAPGLGTIIGAILGGFGGRLTENKVRDDKFNVGAAAGEGALSGAFAGIAPAFRAVKGGVAAAKGAGGLADALQGAKAGFTKVPGAKVAAYGESLIGKARGITPGVGKTAGRPGLTIKDSKGLNSFLTSLGIRKGSALQQLDEVEKLQQALYAQQKSILTTGNKKLAAGTIKSIRDEVQELVTKTPGFTVTQQFSDDLAKLGKTRSTKTLNEFRQSIDDLINFNRSSLTPDPSTERLYKALRTSIDKRVSQLSPELKEVNKTLSKLYDAQDFMQGAAKKASSTSELGASGLRIPFAGNRLPGGATQGAQSRLGSALTSKPTQLAMQGASATNPQLLRGGLSALGGQSPQSTDMINDMTVSPNTANMIPPASSNISPLDGIDGGLSSQPDSLASALSDPSVQQQLLLADLMDPNSQGSNIPALTKIFELTAGQEQKPLNATQQKDANTALSALSDLDILESELQRDSGVATKAALPFNSLSNRLTGAGGFEAAQKNIIDALSRLRSGAALTEFETQNFGQLTPNAFDSPELIQQKLQRLREIFLRTANQEPASLELSDALVGANYAQ